MDLNQEKPAKAVVISIEDLLKELRGASGALVEAIEKKREADRAEMNARHRVNEAQKAFDAAISTLKKEAPRGSDWESRDSVK